MIPAAPKSFSIPTRRAPKARPRWIFTFLRWTENTSPPRFPKMDRRTVPLTSSKWPPARNLSDVVPRVNFATAGGSLEWKADSSGFYYTRYPQGNERPPEDANFYQQVYFHRLGTDPKQDTYVIGKDFPRIAEIQLQRSDDGQWLIAAVGNGDGGEFAHYVMDASRPLDPGHAFCGRNRLRQTGARRRPLPALPQRRAARPDPAPSAGTSRSRRGQGHRSAKLRPGRATKVPALRSKISCPLPDTFTSPML